MKKVELLAPAGDLEKLKTAVDYGADAVYFGGNDFSLRAGADNFTHSEMEEGVSYCHERDKKCYLTLNIYAHNEDLDKISAYLDEIKDIKLDGILISDPGVLTLVKEKLPEVDIHLSTQANMTNKAAAMFWKNLGVKRLVLARELSLDEIREIKDSAGDEMELEAFVHGAMCISYSGRCLLSNFMSGRDANKGLCSHPCRWKYTLMEEKREGEYFPVEEDERGTYVMNSNDLCMIGHIPDLVSSGLDSLKIEGRMKSMYYVACVVRAYRMAIDEYYQDPESYSFDTKWFDELCKASHRKFTTGFYYGKPDENDQNYESTNYIKDYSFTGKVLSYDEDTHIALVEQRNKMESGDVIEVFGPGDTGFSQELSEMRDHETGDLLDSAPHPKQLLDIKMDDPVSEGFILRKRV